jgi:ligand-binding SRPBCC domain-containing protein
MPVIALSTFINAPRERCFDLSRSIDLHMDSTGRTHEEAIAGVTRGLIGMGEEVTWRAKHFGIHQKLCSRITGFHYPEFFSDSMVKGAFKRFDHQHIFEEQEGGTLMRDIFDYNAPLGILGKIAERLFLTAYLTKFLSARNAMIKSKAEGKDWKRYLEN